MNNFQKKILLYLYPDSGPISYMWLDVGKMELKALESMPAQRNDALVGELKQQISGQFPQLEVRPHQGMYAIIPKLPMLVELSNLGVGIGLRVNGTIAENSQASQDAVSAMQGVQEEVQKLQKHIEALNKDLDEKTVEVQELQHNRDYWREWYWQVAHERDNYKLSHEHNLAERQELLNERNAWQQATRATNPDEAEQIIADLEESAADAGGLEMSYQDEYSKLQASYQAELERLQREATQAQAQLSAERIRAGKAEQTVADQEKKIERQKNEMKQLQEKYNRQLMDDVDEAEAARKDKGRIKLG